MQSRVINNRFRGSRICLCFFGERNAKSVREFLDTMVYSHSREASRRDCYGSFFMVCEDKSGRLKHWLQDIWPQIATRKPSLFSLNSRQTVTFKALFMIFSEATSRLDSSLQNQFLQHAHPSQPYNPYNPTSPASSASPPSLEHILEPSMRHGLQCQGRQHDGVGRI